MSADVAAGWVLYVLWRGALIAFIGVWAATDASAFGLDQQTAALVGFVLMALTAVRRPRRTMRSTSGPSGPHRRASSTTGSAPTSASWSGRRPTSRCGASARRRGRRSNVLPLSKRRALERITGMRSTWRVTFREPTLSGAVVIDSHAADEVDALIDARQVFTRRTNRLTANATITLAPVHREPEDVEGVPA